MTKPSDDSKVKIFSLQKDKFAGNSYLVDKKLEDNLTTEITLHVKFGEHKDLKDVLSAYTNRTGFVSGTNWKTEIINVEKSNIKDGYFYTVIGILEWRILGATVFSQSKNFEGEIILKK